MIISVLGYMGSGKSHISKLISEKLNFELIELDDEIIAKMQSSIPDIFKTKGEIYFRKVERAVLEEILSKNSNCILSLGGGTPAYYNNMELINEKTKSFFLRASVKTLSERLIKEKENRPLLSNISDEDIPEFIAKHLLERNFYYNKATFTINIDHKTSEEIVKEIITKL